MLENLQLCHYESPTPVQQWVMAAFAEGKDQLACAQTGTYTSAC